MSLFDRIMYFKGLSNSSGGSGGGDKVLDSNGKLLNSVLPVGYPYEVVGEVVYDSETQFEDMDWNGCYGAGVDGLVLDEGETYEVTWDGIKYTSTVINDEFGAPYDEDSDSYDFSKIPFNIYIDLEDNFAGFTTASNAASHNITIRPVERRQIDHKFLPEGYPYSYKDEVVLISEQTVETSGDEPISLSGYLDIKEGKTYTVNFDGTEYHCVAWLVDSDTPSLGNGGFYGNVYEDYGDDSPFLFCPNPDGGTVIFAESGEHTVSVKGEGVAYEPMAEEFLPVTYEEWTFTLEDDSTVTKKVAVFK